MDRLKERSTFEVYSNVDQLNDKLKPVKSKLAFRATRKPDGSIKYRCRLVACGYCQIYGVNYNKTFVDYNLISLYAFCCFSQLYTTEISKESMSRTRTWRHTSMPRFSIAISESLKTGSNVGHIMMRINYIYQEVLAKTVEIKYFNTHNQVAEPLRFLGL
jgi:hypothetical protein